MKTVTLLIGLLLAGCAGRIGGAPAADACTLASLQPGDIAEVEPLWVPNQLVKSPSYRLGGVIVALQGSDAGTQARAQAQAAACASGCGAGDGDVEASVAAQDGRLVVVLRSDDPGTARAMLTGAERRMHAAR